MDAEHFAGDCRMNAATVHRLSLRSIVSHQKENP
jgi:hypothetical protein